MANQKNTGIKYQPGYPLISGANRMAEGYNFGVEAQEQDEVSLLLYRKHAKQPSVEISLTEEYRTGRIYAILLKDFDAKDYEYNFRINGKIQTDPCAYRIYGREHFGAPMSDDDHKVRCGFLSAVP